MARWDSVPELGGLTTHACAELRLPCRRSLGRSLPAPQPTGDKADATACEPADWRQPRRQKGGWQVAGVD